MGEGGEEECWGWNWLWGLRMGKGEEGGFRDQNVGGCNVVVGLELAWWVLCVELAGGGIRLLFVGRGGRANSISMDWVWRRGEDRGLKYEW